MRRRLAIWLARIPKRAIRIAASSTASRLRSCRRCHQRNIVLPATGPPIPYLSDDCTASELSLLGGCGGSCVGSNRFSFAAVGNTDLKSRFCTRCNEGAVMGSRIEGRKSYSDRGLHLVKWGLWQNISPVNRYSGDDRSGTGVSTSAMRRSSPCWKW